MAPLMNRFHTLTARDLMSRHVVELSPDQSLNDASQVLAARELSSAPVVDAQGICLGMLSAADFLKSNRREVVNATLLDGTVRAVMTTAVQSVSPITTLLEMARMMSVEHIHHLPVIENEHVIGVVSTLDVVSAMVNAVDEADAR